MKSRAYSCLAVVLTTALTSCAATPTTPLITPTTEAAGVQVAGALATIAAEKNTTAATLLAEGATICGKAASISGQLLTGTAIVVLNSLGVPVSVTNATQEAVADTCKAIGLVPGPLPASPAGAPVAVPGAVVPTTTLPPIS